MKTLLNAISPGQLTIVSLELIVAIGAISILVLLLSKKNGFKASDGKTFGTQAECDKYELYLMRVNSLYELNSKKELSEISRIGFQRDFLEKLINKGFSNPQSLVRHMNDFSILIDYLSDSE